MENSIEILNELKLLSPVLAGMEKLNIFTVPAGYFDELSHSIVALLKESNPEILQLINKLDKTDVPEGYFDGLAASILNRIKSTEVQTDTEELSPVLKNLQQINVYTVPDGYFDSVEAAVTAKLLDQSAADELRSLSSMLYSIQNENVFEAPSGYFEKLSEAILSKVERGPAKVVAMPKRRNIFKYAAAAAISGVMLFAGYKFISPGTSSVKPEIPTAQIDVEKEMDKLSDESIVKYLQASGEDVDAALVAAAIDEKELPSQEDYLLDDKTLDNFLNNINDKDLKN